MAKAQKNSTVNGVDLVGLYQQAILSIATVQAAKHSAEDSEQVVLNTLTVQAGGNILSPQAIPDDTREQLTRASIDAHIKKIQASQMESLGTTQVSQLQDDAQKDYHNKKVMIKVLEPAQKPVEAIYFNPQRGYRTSPTAKRKVTGIISEVLLDKNILVLQPTYFAKFFNSALDSYAVAIVSPTTLTPMVSVTFK